MDINSLLNVWNSAYGGYGGYYGFSGLTGINGMSGTLQDISAMNALNRINGSGFLEILAAEIVKEKAGETDISAISEACQKYLDKKYGSTKSANSKGYASQALNRSGRDRSINVNSTAAKTDTVQKTEKNFRQTVAKSEKLRQEMLESYKKNVMKKTEEMQRSIRL